MSPSLDENTGDTAASTGEQRQGNNAQNPDGLRAVQDLRFMQAAIRYARRHAGITGTNPSVACLIVAREHAQPWIAGRGVTQIGGRPHAEPIALAQAGRFAKGACAYVTLEPCAHHGVTIPCAKTLIESQVSRVVVAQRDPDSRVDSKGLQMLRDAGIEVVEDIAGDLASWGIRGYLSRKTRLRPWVVLKLAVTSDGYMGLEGAGQVAITGAIANAQTHLMRARADAIMIGSGTTINDDPSLTCRIAGIEDRSPVRIVVENNHAIERQSKFVDLAAKIETFIACPQQKLEQRKRQLAGTSCKFIACDIKQDKIALPELLADLADIGIGTLMVEGGRKLAQSLLEDQLVDEIILYISREKMADKPAAKSATNNRSSWITWPTLPDAIPTGFQISGQWRFGSDKAIRMTKIA